MNQTPPHRMPIDTTITIALGGHALSPPNQEGNLEQQYTQTRKSAERIVDLVAKGFRIILTHGNGPQIGNIIRRVELSSHDIYRLPIDVLVADSQGGMGYMISQCLDNELQRRGIDRIATTIVTTVEVDPDDPEFANPTKPIGRTYSPDEAQEFIRTLGWEMLEFGDAGYRRVVPSPLPMRIIEIDLIRQLSRAGELIIACGGGGIPVRRLPEGDIVGIEAVIDKDRTTALLASSIDASVLVIVTSVHQVALNFGTDDETPLDRMTLEEARRHVRAGQFPAGSMGPKIEAAIDFLETSQSTDARVLICHLDQMEKALSGLGGTWIVRDPD